MSSHLRYRCNYPYRTIFDDTMQFSNKSSSRCNMGKLHFSIITLRTHVHIGTHTHYTQIRRSAYTRLLIRLPKVVSSSKRRSPQAPSATTNVVLEEPVGPSSIAQGGEAKLQGACSRSAPGGGALGRPKLFALGPNSGKVKRRRWSGYALGTRASQPSTSFRPFPELRA